VDRIIDDTTLREIYNVNKTTPRLTKIPEKWNE
jgi:hypothetical protein